MTYSLAEIAQEFSLEFDGDGNLSIVGLCGLSDNLERHLSFVSSDGLAASAAASAIPAFLTHPDNPIPTKANLFHPDPEFVITRIAGLFASRAPHSGSGQHPSAVVHPNAKIGAGAVIGAQCFIGADSIIGPRTVVEPGCVIMDGVVIGEDCVIHPQCTIRERSTLGDRVILQPGVVVGGDGFGFVLHDGEHLKIPQLGTVIIESDVEVGANTTIDRGRFTATHIGRGTKIDNNVMVAHNVQVGQHCLLVAQSGISGSSRLGDYVVLAGQVGLVGHIDIADHVTLLGQSMATKDIRESGVWAGSPARPAKQWRRAIARLYSGIKSGR